MISKLLSYFSFFPFQRRSLGIVFFVVALLVLSRIAEYAMLSYFTTNWDVVVEAKTTEQVNAARRAFVGVQRSTRRTAAELARHETVLEYLSGKTDDIAALFSQVARVSRNQDVSAEVYDKQGKLIAWQGRSGIVNQREIHIALQGVLTSYVTRGPIYSQLFVITPVRVEGVILGAVLIRQTVEVNYPLSNRFITRAGLAEQLSNQLGVAVEIRYGEDAEAIKDGRYISTVLTGIDGRTLGVVSIQRLARSSYLESVSATFQKVNAFLFLLLLLLASVAVLQHLRRLNSVLLKSLGITLLIWLGRYALLWLDIPSAYHQWAIFDPTYFASKFGSGLAKSIGEMSLTSLALSANTTIIARLILRRGGPVHPLSESKWWFPLRFVAATAITAFIFLLLRGYAAVIRSAVFDSNLHYNDPQVIVPTLELGLMFFNLFAISFCLMLVTAVLTFYCVSLFQKEDRTVGSWTSWTIVALLFVTAGFVFDVVQETPLMSTTFRLLFGCGILLFTGYARAAMAAKPSPFALKNFLIVLALSAAYFYPLLDQEILEKDHNRVEVFAREVVRPADAWLKFVVDESLQQFVSDESFDILLNGGSEEVERLAFTCWAKSNAAAQGYNCSFIYVNPDGQETSRFAIGEQAVHSDEAIATVRNGKGNQIDVRELGTGVDAVKIYSGAIRIIAADRLLGYGVVVISAGQHALFRGETPTVFRTTSQEDLASFYRPVRVTEFRNGKMFASNNASLPIGYRLPDAVSRRFSDSSTTSVWYPETVLGKKYETLFVRTSPTDRVVALSLEELDAQYHLFGIVKTLVYYTIVLLVFLFGYLIIRRLQGRPYRSTFRDKLLIALLVTALIPVVVIATYTRVFARERLMETLSQRLNQETADLEENLFSYASTALHDSLFTPEKLAARMKADFNFYSGNTLQLSSRPELYETGILDRRLSGTAYASVVANGKRFHVETESIGLYQYAVGYKPLTDGEGNISGIMAVPTLYKQDEIDEEVAKTNALLFGIYAIIVLVVSLIATTFANRIASPIHKLTEATKRVSLGDLDVKVNARADGEIGDLISSFETMTRDLKRSRENLVQFERELAWKEMAKQVAHEIKNPLTPMKLALQHLRQTYKDKVENFDEVFDEVSQMVIRQVDALSRIASEFSSFARMPKARLERCSLNDILREAMALFEQDKGVRIESRLDQHLPPIMADREELRRAFINIFRNGIQAMEGGGKMIVSSLKLEHDIEVRVQDFGCGIPEEIIGKLFQPNFSTKTDGMGLGLAIVKKTIEDLNGSISIESTVNKGTTVFILIPQRMENHD